jgi:hypothetical protein
MYRSFTKGIGRPPMDKSEKMLELFPELKGSIDITKKYYITKNGRKELSHTIDETYCPTDYHCPGCGEQTVYREFGPGDYYQGETHVCTSCESKFYLPNGVGKDNYNIAKQIKEKIDG